MKNIVAVPVHLFQEQVMIHPKFSPRSQTLRALSGVAALVAGVVSIRMTVVLFDTRPVEASVDAHAASSTAIVVTATRLTAAAPTRLKSDAKFAGVSQECKNAVC